MIFYTSITLYLPSLPLYAALRIPQSVSVGLIGLICIVYCSFGGIKAVTWSNFYHTILLLFTMLVIIVAGTIQSGGMMRIITESYQHDRLSLGHDYFRLDLSTRHTIYNTILSYTMIRLFLHGTSQMQVQSALSLSTLRKSQKSQLISATFYFGIQIIASSIGLILFVNYKDCDPYLSGEIQRQDQLLMHYILKNLASLPMMRGMFIAAIFGATLNTMSSFQSSTSAMVVEDFIKPLWFYWARGKLDDRLSALIGKCTAIVLGVICVLLTFEMDKISGLQQATTTLYGVIGIPILSAFALGTMTQVVNSKGMFAGMLVAISFGLYVFWGHVNAPVLEPSLPISAANCSQAAAAVMPKQSRQSNKMVRPTKWQNVTTRLISASVELDEPLVSSLDQATFVRDSETIVPVTESFDIAHMSYLWLPVFTMAISMAVSTVVSLLTGGSRQRIEAKYLAPSFATARQRRDDEDLLKFKSADFKNLGPPGLPKNNNNKLKYSNICDQCRACKCNVMNNGRAAPDSDKSSGIVIIPINYDSTWAAGHDKGA